MIHKHNGDLYDVPYGRTEEHFILSISRLGLNQMLLTGIYLIHQYTAYIQVVYRVHDSNVSKAAEKRENVKLNFGHRVNKVDLNGKLTFIDGKEATGNSCNVRSILTVMFY